MLTEFLALSVFQVLLVFVRVGAAFLVIPALSTPFIPARVRLLLALLVSVVSLSGVVSGLPPPPASTAALVLLLAVEATIGVFLGLIGQMLLAAINLTGTVMGYATGLMMAQAFDPLTSQQSNLITGFLAELTVVMLFVLDIHHILIAAIVHSYDLLPAGGLPDTGEMAQLFTQILSSGFRLGWQLASPFVVYAIIFQSTLGVIARLMPQLNVLFVAMPAQILFGLAMFGLTIPFIMMTFLGYFENGYYNLAVP